MKKEKFINLGLIAICATASYMSDSTIPLMAGSGYIIAQMGRCAKEDMKITKATVGLTALMSLVASSPAPIAVGIGYFLGFYKKQKENEPSKNKPVLKF